MRDGLDAFLHSSYEQVVLSPFDRFRTTDRFLRDLTTNKCSRITFDVETITIPHFPRCFVIIYRRHCGIVRYE